MAVFGVNMADVYVRTVHTVGLRMASLLCT